MSSAPVVIDNGTGMMKVGFAGAELPDAVFPTFVGRAKHQRVMAGGADDDFFIGKRAEELRGILTLKHPMNHGVVEDWSDMERIWGHIYTKDVLDVAPEEHAVLLTEAALNPRKNREKAAEIFFETFNVPAMFVSIQAVLSLYASGRTTGVVLDSGDGVTHAVPVFEGFALPHAITRIDVAGRDVTNHLQLLLRKAGYNFHTSAEMEVVRQVKETTCYVAYNVQKEEGPDDVAMTKFTLPDGNVIQVGAERFRAAEVLFNPALIGLEYGGIHETLVASIAKADLDLRRTLFQQIVLSGGSTLFPGFGDRLLNEVRRRTPKEIKVRIAAPPERKYSTWIGGAILSSLASFKKMCITAEEFKEDHNVIHRKTF